MSNILDQIMQPQQSGVNPNTVTFIRVYQFGIAAGLSPQVIRDVIMDLSENSTRESFMEAVVVGAMTLASADELPTVDSYEHIVGSQQYADLLARANEGRIAGLEPEEVFEAIQHDLSVARGAHECDDTDVLGTLIDAITKLKAERAVAEQAAGDGLPPEVNNILDMLNPVSIIAPDDSVESFNQPDENDDDGTDND